MIKKLLARIFWKELYDLNQIKIRSKANMKAIGILVNEINKINKTRKKKIYFVYRNNINDDYDLDDSSANAIIYK